MNMIDSQLAAQDTALPDALQKAFQNTKDENVASRCRHGNALHSPCEQCLEERCKALQHESEMAIRDAITGRDGYNDLKLEINRLIWQYSPPSITLGRADELSLKILAQITKGE